MTSTFSRASSAAASIIARFRTEEPWLPPKTNRRRVEADGASGATEKNSGRAGVPVTTPGLASPALAAASPTAVLVAKRFSRRLAMPGRALDSWISVGRSSDHAARRTGTVT